MSSINRARLVNIHFNGGERVIGNKMLDFHGESLLILLKNGGGKTVMIQLLTAPMMHRKYWDRPDRPFLGLSGKDASLTMIEWQLDGGAGFMTCGILFRKAQHTADSESRDLLDVYGFISEYQTGDCAAGIEMAVTYKNSDGKPCMKSFEECRNLFASLRNDGRYRFSFYNMNTGKSYAEYFRVLRTYGVDCTYWETVMTRINSSEGGLTRFFEGVKTQQLLCSRWLFPSIEAKLKESAGVDQMCVMQEALTDILLKRNSRATDLADIAQYKKLRERLDDAAPLLLETGDFYQTAVSSLRRLSAVGEAAAGESKTRREKASAQELSLSLMAEKEKDLKYRRYSARVLQSTEALHAARQEQERAEEETKRASSGREKKQQCVLLLEAAHYQKAKDRAEADLAAAKAALEAFSLEAGEKEAELSYLGGYLHGISDRKTAADEASLEDTAQKKSAAQERLQEARRTQEETKTQLGELDLRLGRVSQIVDSYLGEYEPEYIQKYGADSLNRNLLGAYLDEDLKKEERRIRACGDRAKKEAEEIQKERERLRAEEDVVSRDLDAQKEQKARCDADLAGRKNELLQYSREMDSRERIAAEVSYTGDPCEKAALLNAIGVQKTKLKDGISETKQRISALDLAIHPLESKRPFDIPEELDDVLMRRGIRYTYGFTWLGEQTPQARKAYIGRFPLLPQSVLMDGKDLEKLRREKIRLSSPCLLPVIVRGKLGEKDDTAPLPDASIILQTDTAELLHVCDLDLLDPQKRKERLEQLQADREAEKRNLESAEDSLRLLEADERKLYPQRLESRAQYEKLQEKVQALESDLQDAMARMEEDRKKRDALQQKDSSLAERERALEEELRRCGIWEKDFSDLKKRYAVYLDAFTKKQQDESLKQELEEKAAQAERATEAENRTILFAERELADLNHLVQKDREEAAKYVVYDTGTPCPEHCEPASSQETAAARFDALGKEISGTFAELQKRQSRCAEDLQRCAGDLTGFARRKGLQEDSWKEVAYSAEEQDLAEHALKEAEASLEKARAQETACSNTCAACEQNYENTMQALLENTGETFPMELAPEEILADSVYKKELTDLARAIRDLSKETQKLAADAKTLQDCADHTRADVRELLEKLGLDAVPEGEPHVFPDRSPEAIGDIAARARAACQNASQQYEQGRQNLRQEYEHINSESFQGSEDVQRYLAIRTGLEKIAAKAGNSRANLKDIESDVQTICMALDNMIQKLEGNTQELIHDRNGVLDNWYLYIRQVHDQLLLFDRNSSVRMGDRLQQMFRITLPSMEKYGDSTERHLGELFDRMSSECTAYGSDRAMVSKYVTSNLSTEALFQEAFGFTGLRIHVCKIEATGTTSMKSYEEVASLSGAETFCSAFIILCCILDYQQRDENDPTAARTRTLIMDNPFATITSRELLSAMMQLALKMRTQLICFTAVEDVNVFAVFGNCYECTVHDIEGTRQSKLDFYNRNQTQAKSAMETTHWQEAAADKDGQYTFNFS